MYQWESTSYVSSDCKNNDWLYISGTNQWSLTIGSSYSDVIFYVTDSGRLNDDSANHGYGARPSIYLKSNIAISGGDGSSSNPYTLSVV